MCPPDYYGIEYEINPWMSRSRGSTPERAHRQWHALYDTLVGLGSGGRADEPATRVCPTWCSRPTPAWCSAARFFSSRFRHEVPRPRVAATSTPGSPAHGFTVEHLPKGCSSRGPATPCSAARCCSPATASAATCAATSTSPRPCNRQVLPLELVNPRFYHLDTCFCPLAPGEALYYPDAFDAYGRKVLETHIPRLIARRRSRGPPLRLQRGRGRQDRRGQHRL